jgi:hypothetical protein
MEWLAQQEPALAFDAPALRTDAEWIAAGEAVFDAPLGYGATFKVAALPDRGWYEPESRAGDQRRRHAVLALCDPQERSTTSRARTTRCRSAPRPA